MKYGNSYHEHRSQVMSTRQEGLTKTYNRFHNRGERSEDIARLRALHEEMDQAVAIAYGWSDLDLGHGFHATKQGERYTVSEPARRTVLDRLLALNHQRYAEEIAAGLHEKKKPMVTREPKVPLLPALVTQEMDFAQPPQDPALFVLSLIPYLLSEAYRLGISLRVTELKRAFEFIIDPTLLQLAATPVDKAAADAWADKWRSPAGPEWFIPTLRRLSGTTIRVTTNDDDPPMALVVAPTQPDSPALKEGIRLALRVLRSTSAPAMLPDERSALIRERRASFAAV